MSKRELSATAQAALQRWHTMLSQGDLSQVGELLAPDVVFRSPVAHAPYTGAPVVGLILNTVSKVFQDFRYHRSFVSDDGMSTVLEFSARVGDKELKGIDMIRFNADGKMAEFEVMIRPMSGLQALAAEMASRLAPYLGKK